MTSAATVDFEQLYRDTDPFGYRTRWYEQRKRELLLAALPRPRFGSGWELGCSNGELTAALAGRCDALLGTDVSAQAIALATRRVGPDRRVTLRQASHPQDWPAQSFDLIVFSEVGYYFEAAAFADTVARLATALSQDGCLAACHWRHPFAAARRGAEAVHAALDRALDRPTLCRYEDADFLLQLWAPGPSVAQREQLR